MTAPLLPPVPRPPHDPLRILLGGPTGWRRLDPGDAAVTDAGGCLRLAEAAGLRMLGEPSGSFGGLLPPENVAVADDGSIYLLDVSSQLLKRFDPCSCGFVTIPCTGGAGSAPRRLDGAKAIAVSMGKLFVPEENNRRLSVFSTGDYLLRGLWQPPARAQMPQPWTPTAVAVDRGGTVYVADPANGWLHRFTPAGRWIGAYTGLGSLQHLAVDPCGRLYVAAFGSNAVTELNGAGKACATYSSVAELAGRFPPLPFAVSPGGGLDLGLPCGAFDVAGNSVPRPAAPIVTYGVEGNFLSQALDSEIHRCLWHRILLRGSAPPGTAVIVSTHTAEVKHPDSVIAGLPDSAWDRGSIARDIDGEWDCLIRSGEGRYLWLRLTLLGPGTQTPRLGSIELEFPRLSLRRFLPAVFGDDPAGSDFSDRFLAIFDTTHRSIERRLDEQAALFDPRSAPAADRPGAGGDFLGWLASWIGVSLDAQWPVERRRRFLRTAARLSAVRGTLEGVRGIVLAFLGIEPREFPRQEAPSCTPRCTPRPLNCAPLPPARIWEPPLLVLEHFKLRRWLFLGRARLGDQATLWGRSIVNRSQLDAGAQADRTQLISTQDPYRDPLHVYASVYSVFVPVRLVRTPRHRLALERLMRNEGPAHTRCHLELVEPRFRIGVQSMIGFDAVVGRYPAGVVVGGDNVAGARLGRTSVLSEAGGGLGADGRPHPSMRIGSRSQVGTSTRLD